jgi:hypothetical protein
MWTQNVSNRTKKFKRKAFEFSVLRPEILGLQAVQKSNGKETVLKLLRQTSEL